MLGPQLRRVLSLALVLSAGVSGLAGGGVAGAAAPRAGAPPTINAAAPTVSGTLVARPVNGEGNLPAQCADRDASQIRAAVAANRGLVICTEEGKLVLLQISGRTRYFDREWNGIGLGRPADNNHINAWGRLQDNGFVLDPTSVVQDTSVDSPRYMMISGTLVAKPVNGEATIPPACRDRDQSALNMATQQNRGLVICTEEGKFVLLDLTAQTRITTRYGGRIDVGLLTDGDHLNAWGLLRDNGFMLQPTIKVQDVDLQGANTASQDFISAGGARLTLMVLKSDENGPVQGIIHAVAGGPVHIMLCGGRPGGWEDLTTGKTVDISRSIFNRRTMSYVRTGEVRVVSCA